VKVSVKRHTIDKDFCTWQLSRHREAIEADVKDAVGSSSNLSILATNALALGSYASVVEPQGADIETSLRLACDALQCHFRVGVDRSEPIECQLNGQSVRYSTAIDESKIEATKWLNAYWLSIILHDAEGLNELCKVPIETIRRSTTRHPEFRLLFVEALMSYWQERDTTGQLLLKSMKATDPEKFDVPKSWTLHIDVPLIHSFSYAVSEDGRFQDAMVEAIKKHKKFWSSTASRKDDWEGFLSLGLSAVSAIGVGRRCTMDVQSEYLLPPGPEGFR